MANDVFANGRELACKAGSGKSICAFPDVCFTPPENPTTPPGVPIPYPNTGMANDTTSGSKKVKISGKEVMLKNKSYFKKSIGNEAGSAAKKGVVTSTNRGKVYFTAWSMDVKIEGENAVRHLDMTTHNHASLPGNTLTWPYVDTQAMTPEHPCSQQVSDENEACDENNDPPGSQPIFTNGEPKGVKCTQECADARACALPKFKDTDKVCCMPPEGAGRTGDHLMEVNCFTQAGGRSGHSLPNEAVLAALESKIGFSLTLAGPKTAPLRLSGFADYNDREAPTACAEWPDTPDTKHYKMQASRDAAKRGYMRMRSGEPLWVWGENEESYWTYEEALDAGANSHHEHFPQCDPECTREQLHEHHKQFQDEEGMKTPLRTQIVKNRSRR